MDKLTKTFQSGEVLKALDLNAIKDKVNELVDGIDSGTTITVDSQLSQTSTNPVQNKVLSVKIKELQDAIDDIKSGLIIAEDMDATFSLTSISINNGASSTSESSVSVKFSYSGTPTHYMLSESPSFAGASWIPFTNPASFVLSGGNGSKTIYAKIKNSTAESISKNDSISYSPAVEVSLSSISINNGAESTDNRTINIGFAYSGSPTHFMLSESPTFEGASWTSFSNPATFTLSTGEGRKTVYAKIKDTTKESSVVNDSINYSSVVALTLNSISINNGASSTSESSVSVKFSYSGTPTHYMLSESPSFAGASWIPFTNPASYTLSSGDGNKTIYAKIKDTFGESAVKNDLITYAATVVGSDIVFTDPEFKRIMAGLYDANGDGEVSYEEAKSAKVLGSTFFNNTVVVNADALKFFINTTTNFNGTFKGCVNLESVEYPENWQLGSGEHDGNIKLNRVKLPNNLKNIPSTSFQNCTSLKDIEIPEGVTTIAVAAFLNSGLVRISIPDSTTDIGDLGRGCKQLTFVDLGTGVTNIGVNAFVDSAIETLICRAIKPPTMGYAALNKTTPQIYVPDESVAAYKAATPWWSAHASRIHPLSEYQG